MLNRFFGSNARVKILKLFLLHPEESFYVRQIARNLGLQINSVRRELENLEQIGLLSSQNKEKNKEIRKEAKDLKIGLEPGGKIEKRFYQVNKDFILFSEIKALITKAQILCERDFTEKLKKLGQVKLLLLSGCFIGDTNSRVDLFMVGDFNKEKLAKIISELENELLREVNYAVMTEDEYKYRQEITDVFLYDILEGNKLIIVNDENFI